MNEDMSKALESLGLVTSDTQQSRIVDVLHTVLNLQIELDHPLSFAEIFGAVNASKEKTEITRAWLHRLLKELIEKGMVRAENETSSHRKYVCDINTLIFGLRKMRLDSIASTKNQMLDMKSKIEHLEAINTNSIAQQLFQYLTGHLEIPKSRYLKGIDEFHSITDETIYRIAKKGDIIRSSVLDPSSFTGGANTRMGRIFTSAESGAEIRYALAIEVFNIAKSDLNKVPEEWWINFIYDVLKYSERGLEMRVLRPGAKRYQFVSLNDEVMALMITDSPVTAAWVTRGDNSDLIDNAIEAFEEDWKSGIPVSELIPDKLGELGLPKGNFMVSLLERASKINRPP